MFNLFTNSKGKLLGRDINQLISRLDALLLVLKSCKGSECTLPWQVLHPDKKVTSLPQALQPKFDEFYAAQPDISFSACELGYLLESEGPQEGYAYRRNEHWSNWV
jgi:arylsulfatase